MKKYIVFPIYFTLCIAFLACSSNSKTSKDIEAIDELSHYLSNKNINVEWEGAYEANVDYRESNEGLVESYVNYISLQKSDDGYSGTYLISGPRVESYMSIKATISDDNSAKLDIHITDNEGNIIKSKSHLCSLVFNEKDNSLIVNWTGNIFEFIKGKSDIKKISGDFLSLQEIGNLLYGLDICEDDEEEYTAEENYDIDQNDPCGGKGYTECMACQGTGKSNMGMCMICFGTGKFSCGYCSLNQAIQRENEITKNMTPEQRQQYMQWKQLQLQQNQEMIDNMIQINEEYHNNIREIDRRTEQKHRELNRDCPSCFGTGNCNYCHGSGESPINYTSDYLACSSCWKNHPGKCATCHGTGLR